MTDTIIYRNKTDGTYHAGPTSGGSLSNYTCYMPDLSFGGYVWAQCKVFAFVDESAVFQSVCPIYVHRYKQVTITGSTVTDTGKYIYYSNSAVPKTDNSHLTISDPTGGWPQTYGSYAYVSYSTRQDEWYYTDTVYLVNRSGDISFECVCDYTDDDMVYKSSYESVGGVIMRAFSGTSIASLETTNDQEVADSQDYLSEYYKD